MIAPPTEAQILFGTVCTTAWEACRARQAEFNICECMLVAEIDDRLVTCHAATQNYFTCLNSRPVTDYDCDIDQATPIHGVCVAEKQALADCM